MTHQSPQSITSYRAAIFMVLAGAFFAGANTCVQVAGMSFGAPPASIAFWQYFIATGCALPLVIRGPWRTTRPILHGTRVIFAVLGVQAWVWGLSLVPIWQAIALLLLSPIFVSFGAVVFLGEGMRARRAFAVLAGAVGGAIILAPWQDDFLFASLLPVLAALFWAGSTLLTKVLTRTDTAEVLTVYLLVLILPFNAIFAVPIGFEIPQVAISVVIVSGLLMALAQFFLAKAYTMADATYLQPFDHIKLPLNIGLGFVVFGFVPPGSMWIGAAIILAASAWLLQEG